MDENYVGKFILVDREPTEKQSNYEAGEYICIRQTPFSLHCVKPSVGYDFHNIKKFTLSGKDSWTVCAVKSKPELVADLVKQNKKFVVDANKAGKKNWVEYVYTDIQNHADILEEVLNEQQSTCCSQVESPVAQVIKLNGIRITIESTN